MSGSSRGTLTAGGGYVLSGPEGSRQLCGNGTSDRADASLPFTAGKA
jgi:hypothetical protein